MTFRTIAAPTKAALQRASSPDALLAFLTVSHPNLPDPIRVVSDLFDYVIDGATFIGMPFDYAILSDDEAAPQTELRMQNVDRKIGNALLGLSGERASLRLVIRTSADFNLSVDPRVEIPGGSAIYEFKQFELVDATVDAMEISARVILRDYSQEPYPGNRATQRNTPGLFR